MILKNHMIESNAIFKGCSSEIPLTCLTYIYLIMDCVASSTRQLILNRELTDSFKPTWGLRQGYPLTPYLFVLCMERLPHLIQLAVDSEFWRPIQLNKGGSSLTQLFFANDLILYAEANLKQLQIMKMVLNCFCGQKRVTKKLCFFLQKCSKSH